MWDVGELLVYGICNNRLVLQGSGSGLIIL